MKIEERINEDFKKAMKEKDNVALSALRMVKAALKNEAISKKKDKLSDDETIAVLSKQAKQRKDSIESFRKGGREELAAKEEKELSIINSYLPEKMSEDDLKKLIDEIIKETGANSKKDMGKVMKALMDKAKGRIDGKPASRLVNEALG